MSRAPSWKWASQTLSYPLHGTAPIILHVGSCEAADRDREDRIGHFGGINSPSSPFHWEKGGTFLRKVPSSLSSNLYEVQKPTEIPMNKKQRGGWEP